MSSKFAFSLVALVGILILGFLNSNGMIPQTDLFKYLFLVFGLGIGAMAAARYS